MVIHRLTPEYIYARSRTSLAVRLYSSPSEIDGAEIVFWKRNTENRKTMELACTLASSEKEEWSAVLHFDDVIRYQQFYFILKYKDGSQSYLCSDGLCDSEPSEAFFEFFSVGTADYDRTPEWVASSVFYQIFPERFAKGKRDKALHDYVSWNSVPDQNSFFGGNLQGIEEKTDYLEELGITCIYMTPIFRADFNHKYATTDYFDIDPDFGTKEDFRRLVTKLHEHGIRIILDGVFNHTGVDFEPFRSVREEGYDSRYSDWYYIHGYPLDMQNLNYECVGDYPYMPKLNTGNPEVQDFVISVMSYWIREFGIDGWRLDVSDEVESSLWVKAANTLKTEFPEILLLGESWADAYSITGDTVHLDSMMNYEMRRALVNLFIKGGAVSGFRSCVSNCLMKYRNSTRLAAYNLLGSHDTERIANMTENQHTIDLAFVCLFALPGVPAVYYGDEIGMTGGNDPYCRGGMIWDEKKQNKSRLSLIRELIKLRKNEKSLQCGDICFMTGDDDRKLLSFSRRCTDDEIIVSFNLGSGIERICSDVPLCVLLSDDGVSIEKNACGSGYALMMPACSFAIYKRRKI